VAGHNPFQSGVDTAHEFEGNIAVYPAVVESIEADTGNTIRVVPQGRSPQSVDQYDSTEVVKITAPSLGNVALPQPGATVLIAEDSTGTPTCIGTVHQDEDPVPKHGRKERIVGHWSSPGQVVFKPDKVVVKNGDTDVTVTDTDVTVDADNVTVNSTNTTVNGDTVTVESDDVNLGGTSGNKVARKGDAVEVSDPESGTLTGTITEGSSEVSSE